MSGWAITILLIPAAALHLLWAIGYWMPLRDEAALSRAVLGRRDVARMPGAVPCALVAVALFFAALLPHWTWFPGRVPLLGLIAAAFVLRGLAAYAPPWRRLVPEEPFATLDRRYYGPFCLTLGILFLFTFLGVS
ncbi:MAG: DUF3995 domain-containing protein [Rhodobacteraceae bacterium]|nr:MAG: DUF3995 domain-containing protein [Paracoccaceae bacterium]